MSTSSEFASFFEYASDDVMAKAFGSNHADSDGNYVTVYSNGAIIHSMFTHFGGHDTALFPRPFGIWYECYGRKGFTDEFGIKHFSANKNETAQVLCLLDHFVTFINQIEQKQFTYGNVKVRLIVRGLTLDVFYSDHPEAKEILKELLLPYPFTADETFKAYGRLTLTPASPNTLVHGTSNLAPRSRHRSILAAQYSQRSALILPLNLDGNDWTTASVNLLDEEIRTCDSLGFDPSRAAFSPQDGENKSAWRKSFDSAYFTLNIFKRLRRAQDSSSFYNVGGNYSCLRINGRRVQYGNQTRGGNWPLFHHTCYHCQNKRTFWRLWISDGRVEGAMQSLKAQAQI
ncbi:hypothetical protein LZ554_009214 [Drepanopeziza brunnea f. sp. 'monogermtubi']|nr:hypothetical protein LZ554_009214 [Drepanopeziza brunnea f. sp. 'monogermtubi']